MYNANYLTVTDISERLNISYSTALKFVRNSGIEYSRVGNTYRVQLSTYEQFLAEHSELKTK